MGESVTDAGASALLRPQDPEDVVCLVALHSFNATTPSDGWWRKVSVSTEFWEGSPPCAYRSEPIKSYYGEGEAKARPIIAAARTASKKI